MVEKVTDAVEEKRTPRLALLRKLVLANVGVVALTFDEAERLAGKLAELGELAGEEGRKLMQDLTRRAKDEKSDIETELEALEAEDSSRVLEAARSMAEAGCGMAALTWDRLEAVTNKLVERGEAAQQNTRQRLDEVLKERRDRARMTEEELDQRLETILNRLNIPSKTDIEALNQKITALTEKVEQLQRSS